MRNALICACIAALLCAGRAGDVDAREGWYAALSLGTASIDLNRSLLPGEGFLELDDRTFSYGVDVGYALRPWLALEAGFHNLGEPSGEGFYCPPGLVCPLVISAASARADAWTVSAVPTWVLRDGIALYAEVGATRWRLQPRLEHPVRRRLGSIRETNFRLALGGRAALTGSLDVQLEIAGFGDHQTYMAGLRWWLRPAPPTVPFADGDDGVEQVR
jgi:opacity protein-like surface antigen